ncbi:hypothetical protein GR254_24980, partial [Mycobacterium tuberculosis]|nr:hypothetical protein [Mycobacterium tuberculosis]
MSIGMADAGVRFQDNANVASLCFANQFQAGIFAAVRRRTLGDEHRYGRRGCAFPG